MKRILLLAASFFLLMGMSAQGRRADGAGYERKVLVEELTGTACGWCPRGLVGMKMLRDLYGDRFIGVAVHQFNATDPMYTPDYADIDWSDGGSKGAPCCMIDRNGEIIDPFYGSAGGMRDVAKDFERAMEEKAVLGVTVSGEWNADYTAVQTTAQVEGTEAGRYEMVFVLVADSVAGNTQRWRQLNNYCGYTRDSFDDDLLAPFLQDGSYGQQGDYCKYIFEDVLVGSSYKNKGTQYSKDIENLGGFVDVVPGETSVATYTLTLPTKDPLRKAVAKAHVAVVAMVLDTATGRVMNADKCYLDKTPTAVERISTSEKMETARYNAAGQRLDAPQRGLNMVRFSDGTVRKEVVR